MNEYLFVYGSLRRAANHSMHAWIERCCEDAGPATFQGKLYAIDWYPGVLESATEDDVVRGEVYRIVREREEFLRALDRYEEAGPEFPEPAEYVREQREVRRSDGTIVRAWVYLYNHPLPADARLIDSGDYLSE